MIEVNEYIFKEFGANGVFISMIAKEPRTIRADLECLREEASRYNISLVTLKSTIKAMTNAGVLKHKVFRNSYKKYAIIELEETFK